MTACCPPLSRALKASRGAQPHPKSHPLANHTFLTTPALVTTSSDKSTLRCHLASDCLICAFPPVRSPLLNGLSLGISSFDKLRVHPPPTDTPAIVHACLANSSLSASKHSANTAKQCKRQSIVIGSSLECSVNPSHSEAPSRV